MLDTLKLITVCNLSFSAKNQKLPPCHQQLQVELSLPVTQHNHDLLAHCSQVIKTRVEQMKSVVRNCYNES